MTEYGRDRVSFYIAETRSIRIFEPVRGPASGLTANNDVADAVVVLNFNQYVHIGHLR